MDFSGTSDISQMIETAKPRETGKPRENEIIIEEKKLGESQMMEFTSSIDDLMEPVQSSDSIYTNVTSGRVTGLAPGEPKKEPPKSKNPLNLTDEQYIALIAGVSAALTSSSMIQSKLVSMVPNYEGMNGSIATVLVAALIFFFIMRFLKK